MTEETQQNKIDLVKKMVIKECLNEKYIRKHKKENRYTPNIKKKDLLEIAKPLIPLNIRKELKNAKAKIVVTPHPKEFERISAIKYKEDKNYRQEITKTFAKNNDIICVLKGHETVVSDGNEIYINNTGNAGMATAGSGDVLTGIISAFVCIENKDLLLKVATAVYVHGLAGDFAAKEKTQVSMTATDIISNIFKAVKKITK